MTSLPFALASGLESEPEPEEVIVRNFVVLHYKYFLLEEVIHQPQHTFYQCQVVRSLQIFEQD